VKRIVTLGIIAALAVMMVVTGCAKKQAAEDLPPLRVGTEPSFQPFEFANEKNEIVGFDMDIAKAIADKTGRKLEIVNVGFDGLVGALDAGRIDLIIAGFSIKPDRQEQVDFSEPYFDAGQIVVVRENETAINGPQDLKGKTVAVQVGTTGAGEAENYTSADKIQSFPKVNEAFMNLKNNRVDAVIIDVPVAKSYIKTNPGFKLAGEVFSSEKYAVAVKKGNADLLKQVNDTLKEMQDTGKFDQMVKTWFD
jgi:polar amino acid transport system substrate-binding protein